MAARRAFRIKQDVEHRRISERNGPQFDSRLPEEETFSLLEHLAEGVRVSKDTVVRYSLKAGRHAKALHDDLVAFSLGPVRFPLMRSGPSSPRRLMNRFTTDEYAAYEAAKGLPLHPLELGPRKGSGISRLGLEQADQFVRPLPVQLPVYVPPVE